MKRLLLLLLTAAVVACQGPKEPVVGLVADSAMVVSAQPYASQVGVDIMKKGGNAVDAAIATHFALSVVFPAAGNIGGGGFMVVRLKDGTTLTLITVEWEGALREFAALSRGIFSGPPELAACYFPKQTVVRFEPNLKADFFAGKAL